MLGFCCCVGFSLVATSGGPSLLVVHGLLIVVASFVGNMGSGVLGGTQASVVATLGLSSCDAQGQLLWHTGRVAPQPMGSSHVLPGIKPASPALADRFFTTESTGKPQQILETKEILC